MTAPDSQLIRPVWVEVNLEHIVFNLDLIRKRVGQETEIMAVVKADAYGHGMIPVARKLVDAGVARLAVALPEEGIELREAGLTLPIQIMGELLSAQYPLIIDYNLIPSIAGMESARAINELASLQGKIKQVHIKVDTGMGRIGAQPSEAFELIREISELPFIEIEGIMTHFASADEADKEYTYYQWERFDYLLRELAEKGISIPIKHAANSAAILDLPQFNLDLVRPGIILYGMMPSSEVDQSFPLKPALSWKTRIVFLKEVGEGTAISYGSTFVTQRRSRIATIPLGYADGYSRLLSNQGQVLINGLRAPVVGRICMDQFMIDVTDIPDAAVGDEVVLIGRQGEEEITAMEMADLIGTINYEITCNIAKRVPRIYL
jgi:alanine racemase